MKIACCAYSYRQYLTGDDPQMTMEGFVELCAGMGLDGVELTSYYFPPNVGAVSLMDLRRKCFLLGLDVSGTAVGNRFTFPPGEDREKNIQLARTWIDNGAILGAPCIRVFAGSVPEGTSEEQAIAWVAECCQECADYGAQRGVMVALENHGGVTATADQVLAIAGQVKSDWFGLNLDTGNFQADDPYADIAKVAPYAITTHIKTVVAPRGGQPEDVDLPRLVGILRDVGYRGYLSFEYEDEEDPKTAVPRLADKLRAALT